MSLPKYHWSLQPNRDEIIKRIAAKRKGQPTWNKGKKTGSQTLEHRLKRGAEIKKHLPRTAFKKGISSWNKGLSNTWAIGEKNPNWNGGSTKKNKKIRGTPEMKIWRMEVLTRDRYICQLCGVGNSFTANHIKSFSEYPELRFDVSNGRTLCLPCHKKTPSFLNSHNKRVD